MEIQIPISDLGKKIVATYSNYQSGSYSLDVVNEYDISNSEEIPLTISYTKHGQGMDKGEDNSGLGIREFTGTYVKINKYDILIPFYLTFDLQTLLPSVSNKEKISPCSGHIPRFEDRYSKHQTCKYCGATRSWVTPETDEKMYDFTKYGYSAWK